MKTQSILKTVLLAAGFSAFTLIGNAGAQTLLTGGDSTDGWVAPSNSVIAYNLNDGGIGGGADSTTSVSTSQVIQGVTFTSWDGWASVPAVNTTAPTVVGVVTTTSNLDGASYYPEAPNSFGASPNDVAMAAVVQTLFYNYTSDTLTFSITNLAAGNYILDEFVESGDSTRTGQNFSIDGVTTNSNVTLTQQDAYVIENTVTVTGAGTLNFAISGPGTPELGGFDLSSVPSEVPEPTSVALIGLGALALLINRRRRTV